jgi:methyltransferase (TIGR00027 family)
LALDQKTRTRTARNTAEAFASLRAAGASVRDEQVRNPDHLASRFIALAPRLTTLVKVPALRPLARRTAERVSPGAYYYELARVKHIDRVLSEELDSGIDQLVILGAGFDTRAYRFVDRLCTTRVFELDHPVTAAMKQTRVRNVFGGLPGHVTYVASDLEHEELSSALARAGFQPGSRTLFLWSGVSFYLSAEAVDSVLAFVRTGSGPGSSIVFDYHYRGFTDGTGDYYGAREGRRRVEELGEPCIFGIDEGGVSTLLERHGLELVSDLGPSELERRYLIRSDGTSDGRPFGFISIAHARVAGRRAPARGDRRATLSVRPRSAARRRARAPRARPAAAPIAATPCASARSTPAA